MRRSRRLAAALLLSLLVMPLPAAVRAADVATSIELDMDPATVTILDVQSVLATVTPRPDAGTAVIEVSYDGGASYQTVEEYAFFPGSSGLPGWGGQTQPPHGVRLVRARYLGAPGYLPSETQPVEQTVNRRTVTAGPLVVEGPDGQTTLMPGSSPVRISTTLVGPWSGTDVETVFEEQQGDTWVELGRSGLTSLGHWSGTHHKASIELPGLAEGSRVVRARFLGSSVYEPAAASKTVSVVRPTLPVGVGVSATVRANHGFEVDASITGPFGPIAPTGTLTIKRGNVVIATSGSTAILVNHPPLPIGTYTFTAQYSGDVNYTASQSTPVTVQVVADTVDATGVGVSATTFYPQVDGYRDTISIAGNRSEPIAVAVRIYNASGARVKSWAIASGSGKYSVAWNGRDAAGVLVPAGHYRVDQTLTDAFGTRKVVSSTVYASWRKLVEKTTYVNLLGSQTAATGREGTGSVSRSTSAGWTRLIAGSNGWAGAGWQFTLPEAVTYKSIQFHVQARGPRSVPPNVMGIQNFSLCAIGHADWEESCFDKWAGIGNSTMTTAWFFTSGAPSVNRSGRTVRGMVSQSVGTTYVYAARVRVVYTLLQ